jgi:hypothetical protein
VGPSLARLRALRSEPVRAAALLALGIAIAAALWQIPEAFRDRRDAVQALRGTTALERELRGARGVDVDTEVLVRARGLIAPDERYAVVTGPNAPVSNAVTVHAVAPFAGYWLLPRRQVQDPSEADWVLSYGGDLSATGLEYGRVVGVAPGIALAEVRR